MKRALNVLTFDPSCRQKVVALLATTRKGAARRDPFALLVAKLHRVSEAAPDHLEFLEEEIDFILRTQE